mgnify:CR=1 FL=1
MSKFKVGDVVRRINDSDWPHQYGKKGEIYTVLDVKFGGPVVIAGGSPAMEHCFELVRPADWRPKVGDRVRMVREVDGHKADYGATVVLDDGTNCQPLLIQFDERQPWSHGSNQWYVDVADLEPMPADRVNVAATVDAIADEYGPVVGASLSHSTERHAIVALIEDNQPKPATRPYVHSTVFGATVEAQRLANANKGKKFGVYVLNGEPAYDEPPKYDHEWQRLAAAGDHIGAIRELRGLTGMGVKPTKDAVEYFLAAA